MKKIIFLIIAIVLSACTPQVTVTTEATVTSTPPPTQTPIPTPTFHPAFVEMQTRLADLGLTLLPDGTVEMTADGGRQTVPDLQVTPDGQVTITLKDGTVVALTPEEMSVDDKGRLKVKGYELDENGQWVESISPEIQAAMEEFGNYTYSTDNLEFKQNGDDVWAVDKDSGKTVYEKDGDWEYGKFYQWWVVAQAGQLDLMPTNIEVDKETLEETGWYFPADRAVAYAYFGPLWKRMFVQFEQEYGFYPDVRGKTTFRHEFLKTDIDGINYWGSRMTLDFNDPNAERFFSYELADGTIHIVPLK